MESTLRVLVLEPFAADSHASLYRGWRQHSRHQIEVLDLPAVHWKWRARHSSITLAERANQLSQERPFDLIFCSSMLNLPEWRGFANSQLAVLPAIVYFHENQFTYPIAEGEKRDYHFAYNQVLSVLNAQSCWFNSRFHQREFESAAVAWLKRMPDFRHIDMFRQRMELAQVLAPGFIPNDVSPTSAPKHCRPPAIGWVSRWEYDKRPDRFVAAVEHLIASDCDFELILLGQRFQQYPECLNTLQQLAGGRIVHAGYATTRDEYWNWLTQMDLVVSTADHEFFGIGIVEALHAGAFAVVPKALSYPEVLGGELEQSVRFYNDPSELASSLKQLVTRQNRPSRTAGIAFRYTWPCLASTYDRAAEEVVRQSQLAP